MYKWIVTTALVLSSLGILLWATGCGRQVEQSAAPHAMAPPETSHSTEMHHGEMEMSEPAYDYTYTCPMHPEIKQDHPGRCSIADCGMFLEAETDEAVEYFCQMDEDVVQDEPGKCPVADCGMFLEARPKSE